MGLHFIVKQTPTPVVEGDKDDSSYDRSFLQAGAPAGIYNENSKFGTGCLKFMDDDQKLTTAASSNLNLGTAFTIDFWMRFDPYHVQQMKTNGGCKIISNYESSGEFSSEGYEIGINDEITSIGGQLTATYYYDSGKGGVAATLTATDPDAIVSDGAWHHICLQRGDYGEGNMLQLFVDGVSYASTSSQASYVNNTVTANPFTIGARATSSGISLPFLYGTIDELEIIDGVSKFATGGFTPPVAASSSTANHLLLMHFDSSITTPTVWYDAVYENVNYWTDQNMSFTGGGSPYWTVDSSPASLSVTNGWYTRFKPRKARITGTVSSPTTVTIRNGDEDILASGTAAEVLQMLVSHTDGTITDDIRHIRGLEAYTTITNVQFDAHPIDPQGV